VGDTAQGGCDSERHRKLPAEFILKTAMRFTTDYTDATDEED
jgi:hypothetical protein